MISRILFAFISFFIYSSISFGLIRDYQTTRMISTSGAGVASILMVEALTLNPSTAAYFKDPLVYAQHNNSEIKNKNSNRPAGDQFPKEPSGYMLAVTDTSSKSRGGFSYQNYQDNATDRTRYSLNIASGISPSSSFGITYHYTEDDNIYISDDKFHRVDAGYLYFFNQDFSFGMVLKDLGRSLSYTTTGTIGFQYLLSKHILVLLDMGYNYHDSLSGSFYYRVAGQVKFLKDLAFRAGLFDDRNLNTKGGSWGLNWTGPRFGAEFAMQTFRAREELNNYLYKDEKVSEMSFSLTVKI